VKNYWGGELETPVVGALVFGRSYDKVGNVIRLHLLYIVATELLGETKVARAEALEHLGYNQGGGRVINRHITTGKNSLI